MKRKLKIEIICSLCFSLLLCTSPFFSASPTVIAVENAETETDQSQTEKKETPRTDAQGRPILGEGETGIMIEAKSGTVLFESDSQKRVFPASTTKIMTGLLAVEALEAGTVSLETQAEITEEMLKDLDPDSSNMELVAGERISFERLLQGLMIPSGNDAAMAIAYLLAGSPETFIEQMNRRASELGLKDTHFENPHGLHSENHYTTAADMAVIAKEAMTHEAFRNVVDIAHIKMPPTNMHEKQRYYINTNGLLSTMRYTNYYYKGAIGIKTGHTTQAGNCLVGAAVRDGMELITAVFGGKDVSDSHKDTIRMLDYGFSAYELITPISKGEMLGEIRVKQAKSRDRVTLSASDKVTVVVPKGTSVDQLETQLNLPEALYAPVAAGQTVGTISVLYNGQELGSGPLYSELEVKRSFFWPAMAAGEWLWQFTPVRILCYLLLGFLGGLLLLGIYRFYQEIKRVQRLNRKHRRQQRRK